MVFTRWQYMQFPSSPSGAGSYQQPKGKEPEMAKEKTKERRKRSKRKERKNKEKTSRGFMYKLFWQYLVRARGRTRKAAALHMHLPRGGRGCGGDRRQLLWHGERPCALGVVLPALRPAAHPRQGVLLRLVPESGSRHATCPILPAGWEKQSCINLLRHRGSYGISPRL